MGIEFFEYVQTGSFNGLGCDLFRCDVRAVPGQGLPARHGSAI